MAVIHNRVVYEKLTGRIIYQTGESVGNVVPYGDWGELSYMDIPYGSVDYSKAFIKEISLDTLAPIIELYPEPELTTEQLRIKQLEEDILLLQTDAQVGGIL
ncbi:hypothetical protein [Lysinibacillus capsici]|uniref:hypothetical protein n=1 Tax=Lysinibacillus capsici TaxID=2115968 RepID=UPI002897A371|nr:hypothetical protein [Lysinibacillus capsici]